MNEFGGTISRASTGDFVAGYFCSMCGSWIASGLAHDCRTITQPIAHTVACASTEHNFFPFDTKRIVCSRCGSVKEVVP